MSSAYGFISGAYMPIASFGVGLQNVLMFFPSTYGTSLMKNHTMQGVLKALSSAGMPAQAIEEIKKFNDLNLSFFGNSVSIGAMYGVILGSILLLLGVYIVLNVIHLKKRTR